MSAEGSAYVEFVDVGQGDCTLVVDVSTAEALVIDCKAGSARAVLWKLRRLQVETVDVLITHWDADHYPGAVQVAKNFPARNLYFNLDTVRYADAPLDRRQTTLLGLEDRALEESKLHPALEGCSGTVGGYTWRLLAPTHREMLEAHNHDDRNHGSAVVEIAGEGTRVLVGGDADGRVWQRLLVDGALKAVDVLRCAHHGGGLGRGAPAVNDDALLASLRPRALVVSAGTNNIHGHPRPQLIRAAVAISSRVLCTQATPHCGAARSGPYPCAGNISIALDSGIINPNEAVHEARMVPLIPMCKPESQKTV
jgi:competence protein ComEC